MGYGVIAKNMQKLLKYYHACLGQYLLNKIIVKQQLLKQPY